MVNIQSTTWGMFWARCVCGQEFHASGEDVPAERLKANDHVKECEAVKRGDWIARWKTGPSESRILGRVERIIEE